MVVRRKPAYIENTGVPRQGVENVPEVPLPKGAETWGRSQRGCAGFELEGGAAERVPSVQAWGLAEAGWNLRILAAVPLQGPDSTGQSPRWPAEGRSDPIPGFKEAQGLPSEGEAGLT